MWRCSSFNYIWNVERWVWMYGMWYPDSTAMQMLCGHEELMSTPSRPTVINRAKSYGNVHRRVFIDDLACRNALCKVSKSQEALLCTVRTSTNTLKLECINTNLTEQVSQIMNSHWYCPTSTLLALWEHLALSKTALKSNPTTVL